jgi:hypothetical protein
MYQTCARMTFSVWDETKMRTWKHFKNWDENKDFLYMNNFFSVIMIYNTTHFSTVHCSVLLFPFDIRTETTYINKQSRAERGREMISLISWLLLSSPTIMILMDQVIWVLPRKANAIIQKFSKLEITKSVFELIFKYFSLFSLKKCGTSSCLINTQY